MSNDKYFKVIVTATCYGSDNKRKRTGDKIFIEKSKAHDFSILGMSIITKDNKTISFTTKKAFADYCSKNGMTYRTVKKKKPGVEIKETVAVEPGEESESDSNTEDESAESSSDEVI